MARLEGGQVGEVGGRHPAPCNTNVQEASIFTGHIRQFNVTVYRHRKLTYAYILLVLGTEARNCTEGTLGNTD